MARINIEEIWWMDPRRDALANLIGESVDTVALKMWRLAQEHWKKKRTIPKGLFFAVPHAVEFLDCGLAEEREDGVYIKGSNEHFQWYHDQLAQFSEAGKKSAEARKAKFGSADPRKNTLEPNASGREQNVNDTGTVLNARESSSSSSSSSSKNKEKKYGRTEVRPNYQSEFEKLWKLYERRGHKSDAAKKFGELGLNQGEYQDLCKAIVAYLADEGSEKKYRLHFERFLAKDWRQYLPDPDELARIAERKSDAELKRELDERRFRFLEQQQGGAS